MQKKYVFILFCFLSGVAVAQLPQNLARFTQTLKNLAAKLPAGLVPPPLIPLLNRPAGKDIAMPDDITAPPGSTAQEADADDLPIITVPKAGGSVTMSGFGGYVGVTVESEVVLPNKTVVQVPANKYIAVEGDSTVKITPKSGVVWPPPILPSLVPGVITVPASGKVTLAGLGEEVIAPKDSTIEISDAGIIIKVPAKGGKVTPPSIGAIIEVAVNSTVEIEGQPAKTVIAGGSIVSDDRIVTITPKGAVPPPLIPPGGKNIPVPSSGDVKLPSGTVKVSKDSKVTELPSGEVDITLSSDSSVTLANKKVIKAPKDSTIKLTEMGPDITIPVINKTIEITVPAGTGITASNDVTLLLSNGTTLNIVAGEKKTIMVEGPVKVSPLPAKSSRALAPTDRKPGDILKTVGNVIQLQAPSGITNAQAISGYVAVYYAFNELSRAINGKDLTLTFDQFLLMATRSIKKRRIQVAFEDYLANILKSKYLIEETNLPTKELLKLKPITIRNIYYALLTDLAKFEAEKYISTKYKEDKSGNDRLESLYTLDYKTILNDLTHIVDKKRDFYIKEIEKVKSGGAAAATLNALINEADNLKTYANIDAKTIIQVTADQVLTQLHLLDEFGREEGEGGTAMPTGLWLKSSDIKYLFSDPVILKALGLLDVSNMVTTFDDLNLLKSTEQFADLGPLKAQELESKVEFIRQDLAKIVTKAKDNLHIFIVNIGYSLVSTNRASDFRWMVIVRYPNNEYVVADPLNTDRIKNVELQIIQEVFKS